ncbi:phosphatase PAP2 family protein [Loigolactobacillus backii]|uniref:phosphatase PAP2 family protein n=1 Tax=Loigolactobacillus backii TaxID=375175 RepID=UPI0007F11EC4|nr:phosphatase PAP2 family protein [Loigolactobacillus backii]ANK59270.1 hypothetical protein AYR52_02790 [Loigolactobacillus backii]
MQLTNQQRKQLAVTAGISYFIFFLILLSLEINANWLQQFDQTTNAFITQFRQPSLNHLVIIITEFGNPASTTLIALILILLLAATQQNKLAFLVFINVGFIAGLINHIIKELVQRPRPTAVSHLVNAGGFSFPSGHATTSVLLYGTFFILSYCLIKNATQRRHLTYLWVALPLLIGLSRIYVGVHNTSDVIAGWSFGLANLCLTWLLFSYLDHVK